MKKWTDDEVELLSENIGKATDEELVALFDYKYTIGAIKTKANRALGYTSKCWSKEEVKILYDNYEIMSPDEVSLLLPKRTKNNVIKKASKLGLKSPINKNWSEYELNYIKNNWKTKSDLELASDLNRDRYSVKNKRHIMNLYRRDMNKSTYPNITKYLRGQLQCWKNNSMKNCVLTHSKNFDIHHIYNVNRIINDIFISNNLVDKNIEEYSKQELDYITELFIKEHDKYPLGVCVRHDIHVLFHSLYGQYDNNEEQWNIFVNNYKKGLYNT